MASSTELWSGPLSLLKLNRRYARLRREFYELIPFHWSLVQGSGTNLWMYGYKQVGRTKLEETIRVTWWTLDMRIPQGAKDLCRQKDVRFLAVQNEKNDVFILQAANKEQRTRLTDAMSTVIKKSPVGGNPMIYIDLDIQRSDSLKSQKTDMNEGASKYASAELSSCTSSSRAADESHGSSQHTDPLVGRPVPRPRHTYLSIIPPPLPPRPSSFCETDAPCRAQPAPLNQDLSKEIDNKSAPSLSHDKCDTEEYQSYSEGKDTTFDDKCVIPNDVGLEAYVERFHEDQFVEGGVWVEEHRDHLLCKKDFGLAFVGDNIIVAWNNRSGFAHDSRLSIGDVIRSVSLQMFKSKKAFYKLVRTSVIDKIKVQVSRCPYGDMAHITLPQENHIDALGVTFGDGDCGSEIRSIDRHGLLRKSNHPAHPHVHGIVNAGKLVHWNLVEINGVAVPFEISKEEVKQRLVDAGKELALLFLPSDLIEVFREVYAYEKDYEGSDDLETYTEISDKTDTDSGEITPH